VKFTRIFPGWYQRRATHIHFRVYLALDLQATSQIAFPDNVTAAVYNTSPYAARGQNTTTALADGIFADGVTYQLPTTTANARTGGYDAVLTVGIDSWSRGGTVGSTRPPIDSSDRRLTTVDRRFELLPPRPSNDFSRLLAA
jgi:hypothetical protein